MTGFHYHERAVVVVGKLQFALTVGTALAALIDIADIKASAEWFAADR